MTTRSLHFANKNCDNTSQYAEKMQQATFNGFQFNRNIHDIA